ncbi:MAG: YbjQ family protein [Lachnospiraceae bacterium]|nr:YbjQ family protein [Lachnospiraceae bacterium]
MPICDICGETMNFSGQATYIVVPGIDSYVVLCKNCGEKLHALKSKTPTRIPIQYFDPFLKKGDLRPELKDYITQLISEADKRVIELEKRVEVRKQALEKEKERKQEAFYQKADNRKNFKMTTGHQIDGYKVKEYISIVSGEVVLGTGFLTEIAARVSDVLGSGSYAYEEKFGDAKQAALTRAVENALNLGANALLSIDFDILTIANNMIVTCANGTAVFIEKEEE